MLIAVDVKVNIYKGTLWLQSLVVDAVKAKENRLIKGCSGFIYFSS